MCVCNYVCMCVYVCMYVCMRGCVCAYVYVCVRVRVCVCVCVSACVCVSTWSVWEKPLAPPAPSSSPKHLQHRLDEVSHDVSRHNHSDTVGQPSELQLLHRNAPVLP